MLEPPPISLVCFDLASTIIDDSAVERAFTEAIATQGLVAGTQDYVRSMVRYDRSRGRAPTAVLRELFDGDELRAQAASLAFERSFRAVVQRFGVAVPQDIADVIGEAASSGVKVCLLSMLSRSCCCDLPGLRQLADLVLCADDLTRGFPWPDPVLTAVLRLGAADVREVAMVSGTVDGVLSGYRAGAGLVVGLGSDPDQAPAMREAGATHVLGRITDLSGLVMGSADRASLPS